MIEGRCLCGDVRLTVTSWTPEVSVCHCTLCQRWGGGLTACFEAPRDAVTVTGNVSTYRATDFAERGFCPRCGSNLWFKDDDGDYDLCPGAFPAAADFPLVREVYADRAQHFAHFAGDHTRVSRADYESRKPHLEGEP